MELLFATIFALLQLVVCIMITYIEYKNKSCGIFLWAMMLVIFCLPHFFTVLNFTSNSRYPLWVYNSASIFALLFNVVYLITRFCGIGKNQLHNPAQERDCLLSTNENRFMHTLFYIMCISASIRIYHLAKYSGGIMSTSWGDMLTSGGGYFGVEQIFRIIFYCSSSVIYPALYYKKKKLGIFSILVVFFVVIVTRNRADILPLLISIVSYILSITKKINLKLYFRLSLFGFLSIVLIYAVLLFRFYGSIENFIENADFITLALDVFSTLQESDEGDLSVKEAFYFFIFKDNKFPGFNSMHTYLRMVLFFLPTQWSFGIKPDDFAETMGAAWDPSTEGFSMHPTLYGDSFANMYYFGFLLAIFWAVFVKKLDCYMKKRDHIFGMCSMIIIGCAFIMIGRGSVYNPFVSIIYELLILYFIQVIAKKQHVLNNRTYQNTNNT